MKRTFSLFMFVATSFPLFAQQPFKDYKWDFEYIVGGAIKISFLTDTPNFELLPVYDGLVDRNYASLCDTSGHLACYSNGQSILSKDGSLMEGGHALGGDSLGEQLSMIGSTTMLPMPGNEFNEAILFHKRFPPENLLVPYGETVMWGDTIALSGLNEVLYYSKIDLSANGGMGKVTEKNIPIIQDSIEYSRMTACRHANGRDWWIVVPRHNDNSYYKILVDPSGVSVVDIVDTDSTFWLYGSALSCFSPDGSLYIRSFGDSSNSFIAIYDFDRCTGNLSYRKLIYVSNVGWAWPRPFTWSMLFSPNSRYIYAVNGAQGSQYPCGSIPARVHQFDLWADDVQGSVTLVGEYDSLVSPTGCYSSTLLFLVQGADGKIYITQGFTQNGYWSTIEHPNRGGLACEYGSNTIAVPGGWAPYLRPNYNLGPLDGSPCDTLGLDNHPKAKYRYDYNEAIALTVNFEDYSILNPTSWSWDFGDGTATSQDTSPVHNYAVTGMYEVCLTVSNQNASDTYCKVIPVGVSDAETPDTETAAVWPNPFSDYLHIKLPAQAAACTFVLYNAMGQEVIRQPLATYFINKIATQKLARGVYFYEVAQNAQILQSGKLVKQ